jgi:OmpA-OmpF porin, OOP family
MTHRMLLLANLTLALCAGQAHAQEVRLFGASESVDPSDVARILDQSQTQTPEPQIKFRSIKLLDDPTVGAKSAPQTKLARAEDDDSAPVQAAHTASGSAHATSSTPSALALPVQFEFDSAVILPSARRQLDALAEGIRMLPPTRAVVIEGHTDATGSEQYNEQLSERRAYSVKSYLVAMHKIDPARLHTIGMGQFGLLAGFDADAAENRRVQFRGE